MPVQFTHPGYLLLLPPLVAAAWWLGRGSLAHLGEARRRGALILRGVVLLLLVLALSGLQVVHTHHALCTVFALDVSASVPEDLQRQALDYVRQACRGMRKSDTAALVVFGGDACVEVPPEAAPKISRLYSRPSRSRTDLAAALRLAMASFPPGTARQIVLLSDGNENLGRALDQALGCKSAGIRIHTVALRAPVANEALIERTTLPAQVKQGEPFEVKVVCSATRPASGRLRLFRNGMYVAERAVSLTPGKSLVSFRESTPDPGFYTYEAQLTAGPDTIPENNRGLGFVQVRGKPRVLVLAGAPQNAQSLVRALSGQHIAVTLAGPAGVPTSLPEWRGWDAVVLCDIPAYQMAPEQMLMLQSYVRDLGGGFAMLGGEEGFGAGGYFRTPVEEVLPVGTEIRKHKILPSLAVLLIMDTSGSSGMPIDGVEMVRLEAEAAVQVVQTMQAVDQIGVIVSGEGVNLLYPMQFATNPGAVAAQMRSMAAGGGGIYCQPAMELAFRVMRGVKARYRHVIMLADGSDCDEQGGCDALAALMAQNKITFSTVSFGQGPHTQFLQEIAALGGGRSYLALHAYDLPRIFTKDAMLASKSLLVEEPFRPRGDAGDDILRGLDPGTMPPLLGYVATTPKDTATVALETPHDDPLLAHWQYGLGRSVAFTSDAQAHWAAHWLGWPGYAQFWSQAVRWMLMRSAPGNLDLALEQRGDGCVVSVEAAGAGGEYRNFLDLRARVVSPDYRPQVVPLQQTAPGRYEGEFPTPEVGAYLVTVTEGKKQGTQSAGLAIPYPPDYRDLQPNDALLAQLADATGGQREPAPESVFGGPRDLARTPQDIWGLLLLLAALLWPADIALRRLVITPAQVLGGLAAGLRRVRLGLPSWGRSAPATHEPTLGRLLAGRQERRTQTRQSTGIRLEQAEPAPTAATPAEAPPARPNEPRPPAPSPEGETALSRLKAAKQRAREKR